MFFERIHETEGNLNMLDGNVDVEFFLKFGKIPSVILRKGGESPSDYHDSDFPYEPITVPLGVFVEAAIRKIKSLSSRFDKNAFPFEYKLDEITKEIFEHLRRGETEFVQEALEKLNSVVAWIIRGEVRVKRFGMTVSHLAEKGHFDGKCLHFLDCLYADFEKHFETFGLTERTRDAVSETLGK